MLVSSPKTKANKQASPGCFGGVSCLVGLFFQKCTALGPEKAWPLMQVPGRGSPGRAGPRSSPEAAAASFRVKTFLLSAAEGGAAGAAGGGRCPPGARAGPPAAVTAATAAAACRGAEAAGARR